MRSLYLGLHVGAARHPFGRITIRFNFAHAKMICSLLANVGTPPEPSTAHHDYGDQPTQKSRRRDFRRWLLGTISFIAGRSILVLRRRRVAIHIHAPSGGPHERNEAAKHRQNSLIPFV